MSTPQHSLSRRDFALCSGGLAMLIAAAGADAFLSSGLNAPKELAEAAARLQQFPATLGVWTSTSRDIDPRERQLAGIAGSLRREYRNEENGYRVTLTLLCGPAGPMCVHPPTACFEGIGYSVASGPTNVTFDSGSGPPLTLNKASFRRQDAPDSDVVRVFWGWSTGGHWEAPANPRLTYRATPVLYKLYVTDSAFDTTQDLAQSEAFLADALPILSKALQP